MTTQRHSNLIKSISIAAVSYVIGYTVYKFLDVYWEQKINTSKRKKLQNSDHTNSDRATKESKKIENQRKVKKLPKNAAKTENILDIEDLGDFNQEQLVTQIKSNVTSDSKDDKLEIHKLVKQTDLEKFKDSPEMIEPELRQTLTKQGYKLVGSHSGVKLCRWTKSMLRGQGGCYKHTFYGINSHQCMENTPNLACANKCVFCWRHQKNPTGKEWKWKLDSAEKVFNGLVESHYKMVKQFKGVPGVTIQSLKEGMKLKHAALSLVGEPIMYPEINKYINLLHKNGISSFLVTNGSFPEAIKSVTLCTQIYLSVDASTELDHKRIDRPLFKDGWRRFLQSVEYLSERKERTVFRLTIVKGWNDDEIVDYAKLVLKGKPNFIEIKGVTYCGTSWAGNTEEKTVLGMKNVPFHEEIVEMCERLVENINELTKNDTYEIVSEHEHSNCVCIGDKTKFFKNNKWYSHINFDQFIEEVNDPDNSNNIKAINYSIETPEWAIYGNESKGFSPNQVRTYRKGAKKRELTQETNSKLT